MMTPRKLKLEEFGKYYKLCAEVSGTHRIWCHELRWEARQATRIDMCKEEIEEVIYEKAAQLCKDRNQEVPRRMYADARRRHLAKVSREIGREVNMKQ